MCTQCFRTLVSRKARLTACPLCRELVLKPSQPAPFNSTRRASDPDARNAPMDDSATDLVNTAGFDRTLIISPFAIVQELPDSPTQANGGGGNGGIDACPPARSTAGATLRQTYSAESLHGSPHNSPLNRSVERSRGTERYRSTTPPQSAAGTRSLQSRSATRDEAPLERPPDVLVRHPSNGKSSRRNRHPSDGERAAQLAAATQSTTSQASRARADRSPTCPALDDDHQCAAPAVDIGRDGSGSSGGSEEAALRALQRAGERPLSTAARLSGGGRVSTAVSMWQTMARGSTPSPSSSQ